MNKKLDYTQFQKKPFAFIFFVMRQKKWFGAVAVFCIVVAGIVQALLYPLIGNITDVLSGVSDVSKSVYMLSFLFIVALVVKNIFYRMSGFFAAHWISFMEIFSVQISFDYLLDHSASYFSDRLSGKLQNKLYNIANAVANIMPLFLWSVLTFIIKIIALIIISFMVSAVIGWTVIFFITVSIVYNAIASQRVGVYARETAERGSHSRGVIVDIISNILATKQNCATKRESKRVDGVLNSYRKMHRKTWWSFDIILLFSNFIVIGMIAVTMFISLHFWQTGSMSVGDVVMLFTMLLMLYGDLEFLSMTFNKFMEQYGQLKEGLEEVFVPHDIVDDSDAQIVEIKKGHIVFDDVNFYYEEGDNRAVFEKLSLTIPAGQKIGLVGESGEGKSTFVSLLLRFMDIAAGKIMIDGYDTKHMRQNDLRKSIAYVPQEALLFHRTLEENIKYSNEQATKNDVTTASVRAHALEFINNFPQKFDTLVGERGVKLSGGQKQRVMIARAMLKKSPILVLDEATSSLDSHSEKLIQEALEELMKGRTTIVVAHRLSTLKQMDRIIVFDGGKIVEDGTHEELLEKRGKYFELWQYQSGALQ
ncbi:MAG: ABC transporter ATP-binding protein [Patescibacteria group bacterium]|nr:ABC transporter ATP-binding protein [Patescibacteria group bacterium]